MRSGLRSIVYLALSSCVLAACALSPATPSNEPDPSTPDPAPARSARPVQPRLGPACGGICDCPLGYNMCIEGRCFTEIFSPPPPNPVCGATCQCARGTGCASEQCVASTMTASQNPVIVPAGQTTATWTLTWSAPGFSQVDLWGRQNLQSPGQTIFLGSGPTAGTAPEPMSVGEVATLWLYAHGDTSTPLAILNISGQH